MKKRILLVIITLLLLFSSCGTYGYYRGKYPYLFTQITSSLLGTGSYDPNIRETIYIVETDKYGREIFLTIDGSDLSGSIAVIGVCQKNDNENVYYYPEINFIQKTSLVGSYLVEEGNYIEDCIKKHFTVDEINKLKERNDWNKPLIEEKYIKKTIYRKKPEIIEIDEVKKIVKNKNTLYSQSIDNKGYFINAYLLTNDLDSNLIYTATVIDYDDNVKAFLLCFDNNKNLKKIPELKKSRTFLIIHNS